MTLRALIELGVLAFILIFFGALYLKADKTLYNYDVPLHGCAEKVTLVGCSGKPMQCQSSRVRFVSESCLILEAQPTK